MIHGLLLALASALATNLAFLFKYRRASAQARPTFGRALSVHAAADRSADPNPTSRPRSGSHSFKRKVRIPCHRVRTGTLWKIALSSCAR